MLEAGLLAKRRQAQALRWMWDLVDDRLRAALDAHPAVRAARPGLEDAVRAGKMPPTAAARALVAAFLGEAGEG
jgi:LAO/AO transport system kinase